MKIVGGAKIASPFVFYSMTLREAKLVLKGHRNEMHEAYISQLYAVTNAIGSCFGGKKFKSIDPFDNKPDKEDMAQRTAELRALGISPQDVDETEFEGWNDLSPEEKRKILFQ